MPKLLIVDDEESVRYSLEKSLATSGLEVITAGTGRQGIDRARVDKPDAVVLDVRLPDMSGLDAYDAIRAIDRRIPVVIITAYATAETAIEAMKRGAFEYLLKPLDLPLLRGVVERAFELSRLNRVPAVLGEDDRPDAAGDRIVGKSASMQEVYKAIGRVAPQDVTVLILGESGTGKELVARAIYQHSRRSAAPFLPINCAAIPDALLESELFGHERGAFTGADRRRIGKFEQAKGGTIFLDEIGDMAAATQAKVLRLIQEREFEPVGGRETLRADVRLIAATNRDLEAMVKDGRFRQDLLYRLNDFTIRLPPLRERVEDLPLLIEHFLREVNQGLGKSVRCVAPEAMALMEAHAWPGNIRELAGAIKHALINATGEVLTADCLPEAVRAGCGVAPAASQPGGAGELDVLGLTRHLLETCRGEVYPKVHDAVDKVLIEEALGSTGGNQVEAAEALGISRNTLRSRMRALGLLGEKRSEEDLGKDA